MEDFFDTNEPAVIKPKGRLPGARNKKRNKKKRTRAEAFEESTQRLPSGFEYVEGMRDAITASQTAVTSISSAFTASQVDREEVRSEADACFRRGGETTATYTLRRSGNGSAPPSPRGRAYTTPGRGGARLLAQPARRRPQSDRIRAAATAALSLTRGGRARGNESTVNIYGGYTYWGAYDADAW